VRITGTLQKRAWAENVMPPVEKIRPDMWSIPVPMPDNPLRYVLVYVLETRGGVVLVDAGWNTEEAWTALVAGLARAGYGVADVRGVLVTHIHPDHYGLAGRVQEHSGAWVALHPKDEALLRERYDESEMAGLVALTRQHLTRCGVPPEIIDELSEASMGIRNLIRLARVDVLLEDGDPIQIPGWNLRAVWTPGHSPGHLCFVEPDRRLLLSGDHVLPRISPAVTVHPQQRPSPLADFLDSLAKVAKLDIGEVLPAHEYRFSGLAERVVGLVRHHQDRLTEVLTTVGEHPGVTAWDIAQHLTWSRPWETIPPFLRRSAAGETLAHLILGQSRGLVRCEVLPSSTQCWFRTEAAHEIVA
jgi:glyoxylase-like metal-dependent hydrolase (beta-lactamase superfamily II)